MSDNKGKNYLDFIPVPSEKYPYEIKEGAVTIFQENKGLFNLIAQKLWKKPKVSQIHLDKMGNFIWPLMDGKHTINDIALLIREEFGAEAEPLYERVVQYFRTLNSYGFIDLK